MNLICPLFVRKQSNKYHQAQQTNSMSTDCYFIIHVCCWLILCEIKTEHFCFKTFHYFLFYFIFYDTMGLYLWIHLHNFAFKSEKKVTLPTRPCYQRLLGNIILYQNLFKTYVIIIMKKNLEFGLNVNSNNNKKNINTYIHITYHKFCGKINTNIFYLKNHFDHYTGIFSCFILFLWN